MDWKLLFTLTLAATLTIGGWFVLHRLSEARDRLNKARELQVKFLIEAYGVFYEAMGHPLLHEMGAELHKAVGKVQVFGTNEQIDALHVFIKQMKAGDKADLLPLLGLLRTDLRSALLLPPVEGRVWWLRVVPKEEAGRYSGMAGQRTQPTERAGGDGGALGSAGS